jgi:zinc protease
MVPILFLCLLLTLLGGCSKINSESSLAAKDIRRFSWDELLKKQELPEYTPPQPESWRLKNGLRVLYFYDSTLPLIDGALYIKGGMFSEDKEQFGFTSALGELMRQGGAGDLSGEKFDERIAELGAALSSAWGAEYGRFGFSGLVSDSQELIELFGKMVSQPRIDEERLEIWKAQELDAIKRRSEQPNTLASLAFTRALYADNFYGRILVEEDIKNISRQGLLARHQQLLNPRYAQIVITGALKRERLEELLNNHLVSQLPERDDQVNYSPPHLEAATQRLVYVKHQSPQATVIIGQVGVPRFTEDYHAIDGYNEVLSGGFGSRLFKKIRTELGLAYSVFGGIRAGNPRGTNIVALQTKSESLGQAIDQVLKSVDEMRIRDVSEDELAMLKRSAANSFIFKFSTRLGIIEREAIKELLNYPEDYDQDYLKKLTALDRDDIKEVASTHWPVYKSTIVVVGNQVAYNSFEKVAKDIFPQLKIEKMEIQ